MKACERLETRRLIIKPFISEDDDDIKRIEKNSNLLRYFENICDPCLVEDHVILAIKERNSDLFMGLVGAIENKDEIDTTECFIGLLPEYQKNGYAIEALKCFFSWLFQNSEINEIISYIIPSNTRGWKAAERSGMKYKGQIIHETLQKMMVFKLTKNDHDLLSHY